MSRFEIVILIGVLACFSGLVAAQRKRYDNFHVYKLEPKHEQQLVALRAFDGLRDSYIFMDPIVKVGSVVSVVVAPEKVKEFETFLKISGIDNELLETDAQSKLEDDEVADPNRRDADDYSWTKYHTLNDTYYWMKSLTQKYPAIVTTFIAGSTYEGRDILGVKVSYGAGRKAIFIEGGIHAREWISPATTTYILNQLLTSTNAEVRLVAESFDWYFVPHANPDGYVYTHTTDRIWRKTRTPYGKCFGADPNRNWDFHWNEVGTSNDPCSDIYAGPHPFSEIETKSLADFIESLQGELFLYVSFHSYSQLLLFPYGHTPELPKNFNDLKRIFDAAIWAMRKRYGTVYTGGNIHDAIYPASGASVDWAYGVVDAKYAFCYELRPSSIEFWIGFRLPAAQIIPTGEETLDSLVEMVKEVGITNFY